jgi:hypothetical protein
MQSANHQQAQRELLSYVFNRLNEILGFVDGSQWSKADNLCSELLNKIPPAFALPGYQFPLRFNIIVAKNQILALLQEVHDEEISTDEVIQRIKTSLTNLRQSIIDESPSLAQPLTRPERPKVITDLSELGAALKPAEQPARLVGQATELSLQQSIALLNSYAARKHEIPTTAESGCIIFIGSILAKIHFSTDRLPHTKEQAIKVMNDHWLFKDVAILAVKENCPENVIAQAVYEYSQLNGEEFTLTYKDWDVWHLPGSPLVYSWLIRKNTYRVLQPIVSWLSFPQTDMVMNSVASNSNGELKADKINQTIAKQQDTNIRKQAAARKALERNIAQATKDEVELDSGVVEVYRSLLAERRVAIEKIQSSISFRERLSFKADIVNLIERIKGEKADLKKLQIRIATALADHRQMLQDIHEIEQTVRQTTTQDVRKVS